MRFPGWWTSTSGRRGPDELGPRLNTTVWVSRAAMAAAVGENFDPPIGTSDTFDGAVADFGEAYADQNDRDHLAFLKSIDDGRIAAIAG